MTFHDFLVCFLWVVPVYIAAFIVFVWIKAENEPAPWRQKSFADLRRRLAVLLRSGYHEARDRLTHESSGRTVSFRKIIRGDGDFGLELCFTSNDGDAEQWRRLKAHCDQSGLSYRIEPEASDGQRFDVLVVDCGQDVERTCKLAETVWTEILGFQTHDWHGRESGLDIALHNELVDSRSHRRYTQEEWAAEHWKGIHRRLRQRNMTLLTVWYTVALVPLFLASTIGLPLSTVMSIGEPHDWSVRLWGFEFSGGFASLIFAVLFSLSSVEFARLARKIGDSTQKMGLGERIFGAGLYVSLIGLPVTVTLLWAGV